MSYVVGELGFQLMHSSELSDRICKPCGRNICEACIVFSNYSSWSKTIKLKTYNDGSQPHDDSQCAEATRFKRQLSMTISPRRTYMKVCRKKSRDTEVTRFRTKRKQNLYFRSLVNKPDAVKVVVVYPNRNLESCSSTNHKPHPLVDGIWLLSWEIMGFSPSWVPDLPLTLPIWQPDLPGFELSHVYKLPPASGLIVTVPWQWSYDYSKMLNKDKDLRFITNLQLY